MKKSSLIKLFATSFVSFLLGISSTLYAQQSNTVLLGLGWDITQPINNPFTNNTGYWGGHFGAEYFIDSTYSVGLDIGWNTSLKYIPTQTYTLGDQTGAITTDMYNSTFNTSYLLYGHYHFKQHGRIKPFVGLGLGAQNTEFSRFYSVYEDKVNSWGLIARPEIGTKIRLSKNEKVYLNLVANWSYSTNKNENQDVKHIQNFGVSVGLQFNMERNY